MNQRKIIEKLANRMNTNERIATRWLEAVLETLGNANLHTSVMLSNPILQPMTPEAQQCIQSAEIEICTFPFRVGRESRGHTAKESGVFARIRKRHVPPNNDLYLTDNNETLNVSREHFQIEKKEDGSFELIDRASACGTIVNGQMVGGNREGGRCSLKYGDEIVVGLFSSPFVFQFSG